MRTASRKAALAGFALLAALAEARAVADVVNEPSVAVNLDLAYDSNVLNGKGPDFVTRVTPHLGYRLRDERTQLTLAYDIGIWDYARGLADNTINHRFGAIVQSRLTQRTLLHIAYELVRAEDPAFLIRAGVVAPQTGIFDNFVDGNIAFRITRRLDGWAGYSFHDTEFDQVSADPALHLFSGQEHDGALGLTYRASRLDDLRFSNRVQYFLVGGESFAVADGPAVGWRHQILRALELRIEGGPLIYTSLVGGDSADRLKLGVPSPTFGLGGTDVSWRGAGVLRFQHGPWRVLASGVRDLVSGTGTAAVLWAAYAALSGSYQFDPRGGVHLAASYFWNGDAPSHRVLYDGVAVDASADYRVNDYFRVGAYYSFRWQETHTVDGPLFDVTRHIVGIRLQGVFGAEAAPPHREVHP